MQLAGYSSMCGVQGAGFKVQSEKFKVLCVRLRMKINSFTEIELLIKSWELAVKDKYLRTE